MPDREVHSPVIAALTCLYTARWGETEFWVLQFVNMEQADIREMLLTDRQQCVDGEKSVLVKRICIPLLPFF